MHPSNRLLRVNAVVSAAIACLSRREPEAALRIIDASDLRTGNYKLNLIAGLCLLDLDRPSEAADAASQALFLSPNCATSWCLQGQALQGLGRPVAALDAFDKAVALRPAFPEAWSNRAVQLLELGRFDEAVRSCEEALGHRPGFADALFNRGVALEKAGRLEEAAAAYGQTVSAHPDHAEAWYNSGVILRRLGRDAEAIAAYDAALAARPVFPEAHCDRGAALQALGRHKEALADYDRAIALRPDYAEAWSNRGNALKEDGRYAAALQSYETALAKRPAYPEAWYNSGTAHQEAGAFAAAVTAFERAIELKPDFAKAWSNRGFSLREMGRFEAALASYDRALAHDPDCAETHFNRGVVRLLRGDFAGGWEDYEWRWRTPHAAPRLVQAPWPEWDGSPLAGRRLVVYAEQGLGDTIQFCRYLPLLGGGPVTFVVERKMHRLLRPSLGDVELRAGIRESAGDLQIPLMSLPRLAGTDLRNIPATTAYLAAEAPLVRSWRERIGAPGFRIGLCWHGNKNGPRDRRAVPLGALAPFARLKGIRLISLQKGEGLDEIDALPADMRVENFGALLDLGPDAFVDTAALMMSLDLVITSDTSVAHLAGALGRPVWLALQHVPEWRWQLSGEHSPWYPSMRLFRQTRDGDWGSVVQQMWNVLASTQACLETLSTRAA